MKTAPTLRRAMNRRTFLRGSVGGVGVAVALPGLEAMFNNNGSALADGSASPKRFVTWFWGNGNEPDKWTPTGTGTNWTLSEPLQTLAPIKDYISVISGMRLLTKGRNNPHAEGTVALFGGTNPEIHPSFTGAGGDWNYMSFAGPTLDQVIAAKIGSGTPFKSLEVGASQPHGSSGPGNAISYISHNGPYNPNAYAQRPNEVFARIFKMRTLTPGSSAPDPMLVVRASILDAVRQEAVALKQRVGSSDRRRLDDHMESIRTLEQRVKASATSPSAAGCKQPPEPPAQTAGERMRAKLLGDLVGMALSCDLTRVATMEFSSPASHVGYEPFPGRLLCNGSPTSFHEYEHCSGFTDTTRAVLRYFVEEFGKFAASLKAIGDGAGNLLDQTCVLGTSEVAGGWTHKFDNFPLLLAGKAGGAIKAGLHIPITGDTATINASRLPLTLLRAFGVTQAEWGKDQLLAKNPIVELLT